MRLTASTPTGGTVKGATATASCAFAFGSGSSFFFDDPHPSISTSTIQTACLFPIMARRIHLLVAHTFDPLGSDDGPARARSACVVVGATPEAVAKIGDEEPNVRFTVRPNKHGALVHGRLRGLPIELADAFDGPVYDILYNPTTGWFSVTVFRGIRESPVRYDKREGECGYPRVPDILGATAPADILAALDVPADVIGYVTS